MPDARASLTAEQFTAIRDLTMTAGGLLQRIKPGTLDAAANMIESDLRSSKSLMLSPIARRKGEKLAAALRAAETLRAACAAAALTFDLVDPNERPQ